MNATGNGLVFSTYLGGSSTDSGYGIAVDRSGNSYITGYTQSANFPTKNAYNTTYSGGQDAIISKFNSTGSLVFSTYLGGSGNDIGNDIAIDNSGNSYITGSTDSTNFPTKNAYDATNSGATDVFVTKLLFDDTPPSLSLISPSNKSILHSGALIQFSAFDIGIAGLSKVVYQWDGGSNITLSSPYSLSLITGDGLHSLKVYAIDNAGNTRKIVCQFSTDDTAPIVSLSNPSNNSLLQSSTNIQFSISDALSGIGTVQFNWDGGSNTTLNSPFTLPLITSDGLHVLTVYANDTVGNLRVVKYQFTIDDTAPIIHLNKPANDTTQSPGLFINVTFTDPHNVSFVSYNWDNGQTIIVYSSPNPNTATTMVGSPIIVLPSTTGIHILNIFTNDSLNNQRTESFLFITSNLMSTISTTTVTGSTSTSTTTATATSTITSVFTTTYTNSSRGSISTSPTNPGISMSLPIYAFLLVITLVLEAIAFERKKISDLLLKRKKP